VATDYTLYWWIESLHRGRNEKWHRGKTFLSKKLLESRANTIERSCCFVTIIPFLFAFRNVEGRSMGEILLGISSCTCQPVFSIGCVGVSRLVGSARRTLHYRRPVRPRTCMGSSPLFRKARLRPKIGWGVSLHQKSGGLYCVLSGCSQDSAPIRFLHSEPDENIGGFERHCYAYARRLGIVPEPPLELSEVLRRRTMGISRSHCSIRLLMSGIFRRCSVLAMECYDYRLWMGARCRIRHRRSVQFPGKRG
jgi:hypothetical protein